jgi:hypothetical protein
MLSIQKIHRFRSSKKRYCNNQRLQYHSLKNNKFALEEKVDIIKQWNDSHNR